MAQGQIGTHAGPHQDQLIHGAKGIRVSFKKKMSRCDALIKAQTLTQKARQKSEEDASTALHFSG